MGFLVSFLPSVFYAELDPTWAKSQYLSLLARALPAACYFLFYPGLKSLCRIFFIPLWFNLIIYFMWIFGLLEHLEVGSIIDNSGASAIIASLPFALLYRRYGLVTVSLSLIALSESRMGGFVSLFTFSVWHFGITIRMRHAAVILFLAVTTAACFVLIFSWDVFFPSFLPNLYESIDDRVRRAIQFMSILSIKEAPLLGLGMGQISIITEQIWGKGVLAHGMLSYIWAQSGLFPFLYYLFFAFFSFMRPALYFSKGGGQIFWAISIVSASSFLMFLTRPYQDSAYLFLSLAIGLFAGQLSGPSERRGTSLAHR